MNIPVELIAAMSAAFLGAVFLVMTLSRMLATLVDIYDREWVVAKRENDSLFPALIDFAKRALVEEGLKLATIERMYKDLQRNVVRANYPETAEDLLGQTLLEGFLIFVGLSILCLILFGPLSLLMPLVLGISWVIFIRPSMAKADGEQRSRKVYRRLPYALDLGVLVLQSGGTLRDALEIISENEDPLAEEFRTALKELDSGAPQATALLNVSKRVGVDALDAIVMAVNRGTETGAPMAQTLSTQAELFRERRLQEIEKLAVEAPTKMTFPNMLVMMSVIVIVLGPVLVKIGNSGMI
jgi:tight adherence protein C